MANIITLPLEIPPSTLRVDVAYYNKDERDGFARTLGIDILEGDSRNLAIAMQDFCAYYLYYKLRDGVPGYSTHDDVAKKWTYALAELDGQVVFANRSIRLVQTKDANRGMSERFGEALGLSVVSRLHGLHEGDWVRIPETNKRKTLDFRHPVASDGRRFVLLEAKGSSVADNRLKPATVSNHMRSIKEKKGEATPEERENSVLYGTISVLDDRPESIARCWLVDPPADITGDPLRFKLLARLDYIAQNISFLGQRSQLATALQNRLAALRASKEYAALDGVVLRMGSDAEISTESYDKTGTHNPWFGSKSVVSEGPAGGHVFAVNDRILLFIGIREQMVSLATAQDFEAILKYAFPSSTIEKTVECVVPQARFKREFAQFVELPQRDRKASAGYFRFSLTGHLHYCQSGMVFGVLPIPEAWRTNP